MYDQNILKYVGVKMFIILCDYDHSNCKYIMAFLYLPLYNIYDQMTILVMIVWPALIFSDRSITITFFVPSICKLMYLGDGRIVFNFSDP